MKYLGIALIIYGLMIVAACAAWLEWTIVFYPTINDPVTGFLSTSGIWLGAIMAAIGVTIIAKRRGSWVPPL